jgi:divinyl protochlorophyllide a 8-vinyl-reductase
MSAAPPGPAVAARYGERPPAGDANLATARNRVGPNAVIQTRRVLDQRYGTAARAAIFAGAGLDQLDERDLTELVDVDVVNALNAEIVRRLPPASARDLLWHAGKLTGDYVLEHRIPRTARRLLQALPRPLARRLLMMAITRNAWTFAGRARVETRPDRVVIHDNPICLGRTALSSCVWHVAVLSRLLQTLVDPGLVVRETQCLGRGNDACRFEILSG